jgi:hydroxyethylthiazole kinase-like uncharacterized protein yjeF
VISAYSVEDVRIAERRAMAAGPEGDLMQRAAAALAVAVADLAPRGVYGARIALLVGPGNNGGDALWAGARLARRGARVDALLLSDSAHPEGLAAFARAGGHVQPHRANELADEVRGVMAAAEVVVDGVLGIGGRPGVSGSAAAALELVPDGAVVVAVDLPSGVDPDTGEAPGRHVWADLTLTFGLAKPGLLLPPADRAAGRLHVVDIGLGPHLAGLTPAVEQWAPADVAAAWPVPGPSDDKYSRGVLGVVAGGSTYTGAAVLATGAAVRAGAGMVRYVGPPAPSDLVRARWPEVVPGAGRVQAWVVGPGVDVEADDEQRQAIVAALAEGRPTVVDAGALAVLPDRVDAPTLLTPHAGELSRLLSERTGVDVPRSAVEARPLRHARQASDLTGATVLLKGATCVIAAPDGRTRTAPDGPGWLATAGSGDVLAGLAGALLAAGLEPLDAAAMAVVVHGLAASQANPGGPVHAEGLVHALPATIAGLLS